MIPAGVVEYGVLAGKILLACFVVGWGVHTILVLGMILLRKQPESHIEAVSIGLREIPFAALLALMLFVGPAVADAIEESGLGGGRR